MSKCILQQYRFDTESKSVAVFFMEIFFAVYVFMYIHCNIRKKDGHFPINFHTRGINSHSQRKKTNVLTKKGNVRK